MCKLCSKLTIKTPETPGFLSLTFKKYILAGKFIDKYQLVAVQNAYENFVQQNVFSLWS